MEIILWLHNIRSTHNVGSLLRTAEGFGLKRVVFSGYTPYPKLGNDTRLPHIANKLTSAIHKTALGAESNLELSYWENKNDLINHFTGIEYKIIGLEQDERSIRLDEYRPPNKLVLLLGEEVNGIPQEMLEKCDSLLEIPMYGKKESFNVSVAGAIALYQLTLL